MIQILVISETKDIEEALKLCSRKFSFTCKVHYVLDAEEVLPFIEKTPLVILWNIAENFPYSPNELIRLWKETNPFSILLLLLPQNHRDWLAPCLENGIQDFLFKPLEDLQELVEFLQEHCRRLKRWKEWIPSN
ncbi:MAG: DNA-binding response regulator [Planctomycetota bacterium]|nr:MAG: DNA-binding response regulator [Planctomycetota bacterium]